MGRTKTVDCLFIGHNEMTFEEYESTVRKMGVNSGAYRDLNLNFIQYDNKPYTAADIFNLFYCSDRKGGNSSSNQPFRLSETFSAAIAYLGSYLNRRGFTFDYVNSFQEEKEKLRDKLVHDNILAVAIVTTLYVSPLPILEIVDFVKRYNNTAKIIVGGPFVTTLVRSPDPAVLEYSLKSIDVDFFVNSSQGEAALVNIIRALKMNTPFDRIHNIFYKTAYGYTATDISKENNKLSHNKVNWNLFSGDIREFINVRTAISCPFSCAFCGFPDHAGEYQMMGVNDVEWELNLIDKIKTVKHVHFIDDTFNVPQKRFKEILRMMIKNNYKFKWYSHLRCQFADRETVELMKQSGCEGVFLGIESGNNKILKSMNKAVTVDKYLKGIQLLKQCGILIYGSFIIGFPGETYETIQDTIEFIQTSGLDFFRVQLWYCVPNAPVFQKKNQYKIKGESFEWSHLTMDSREASDFVEKIFLSIETPVWVPQYNFEYDALFHLFHRGMPPEQVNAFLKAFNTGIKEKLKDLSAKEVSFETIRKIKDACNHLANDKPELVPGKAQSDLTRAAYHADFDF